MANTSVVFDIEADGLFMAATRMWILVAHHIEKNETKYWLEGDLGWQEYLSNADTVIGHNIINFDLNVLKKLFNFTLPSRVHIVDTLLMSQILDYQRFSGFHGLANWGEALGYPKLDFEDFSQYTEEMRTYCIRDVELNVKVYKQLAIEFKTLCEKLEKAQEGSSKKLKTYIKAEHTAAQWNATAQNFGWPFDVASAKSLFVTLETEMQDVTDKLESKLGWRAKPKDMTHGEVEIKQPKWIKTGAYNASTANWFGIDPWSGFEGEARPIIGEFCRVEFLPLKLSSSQDVKLFLSRNGWQPSDWNYVVDEDGSRRKTSPKIVEDDLELLGGDGKLYLEYLTSKSRYGILKSWLELVDSDGKLHGDAMLIGTPSMRARHSIIVNVPAVGSKWGAEMRSLFGCLEGWKFIGADSAGNQARGLAHYLGDATFIDTLLNGDIHTFNANAADAVLTGMKVSWDNYLEKQGIPLEDYPKKKRAAAKRILYAFLFGASGSKLWSYIFGELSDDKGKKFKSGFEKAVPGFKALKEKLEGIYSKTSQHGRGYIPSLVGNRIYCDSYHKLLVYLLQSAEKITCSTALMLTVENLEREHIPYIPLIFYHDEIDFMVPDEYAERAAQISKEAFKEGPKLYGVEIMDGESKIGLNWKECH